MMDPDRRALLGALTAVGSIGLAGSAVGAETASSATPSDTRTTAPPTPSVTLRSSFRYYYNTDAIGVDTPEEDQFAFVEVPQSVAGTPLEAFSLELGDREFQPRRTDIEYPNTPGVGDLYTETDRTGALVFDVPTVEVEEGWLVSDGTRYALPEYILPEFARAPSFTAERVSTPDTVQSGDPIEITVEVTNEGDRRGVFLAGAREGSRTATVDIWADPGETTVGNLMYHSYAGGPGDTVILMFTAPDYPDDYDRPSAEIVERTPTSKMEETPTRKMEAIDQTGTPSGDATSAPPSQPAPGFGAVTGLIALLCAGALRLLRGRCRDD